MTDKNHPLQALIDLHNELHPKPKRGDIVDWQYKPLAFDEFRQRQAALLARGFQVVSDKIERSFVCPTCGGDERIYVEMARFDGARDVESFSVEICLRCWSVQECIPVYQSE